MLSRGEWKAIWFRGQDDSITENVILCSLRLGTYAPILVGTFSPSARQVLLVLCQSHILFTYEEIP